MTDAQNRRTRSADLQTAADWLMPASGRGGRGDGRERVARMVSRGSRAPRCIQRHSAALRSAPKCTGTRPGVSPAEHLRYACAAPANAPLARGIRWGPKALWLAAGVVALATVLLAVAPWMRWVADRTHTAIEARDYRVSKGSQQAVVLADRTRVTIGSASEVSSHFTRAVRYVDLQAGEAFFEVKADHSRPFVVKASEVTVTAVGTQFDVRCGSQRTTVAVIEGAVDVAASGASGYGTATRNDTDAGTTRVRLYAGQQAVWSNAGAGLTVSNVSAAAATSWRDGRLTYVMESLGSVVDDVNRYASRPIVIRDPSSVGSPSRARCFAIRRTPGR